MYTFRQILACILFSACLITPGIAADSGSLRDVKQWLNLINETNQALPTTLEDTHEYQSLGANGYLDDSDGHAGTRRGGHGPGRSTSTPAKAAHEPPESPIEEAPEDPAEPKTPADLPVYGEELFYHTSLRPNGGGNRQLTDSGYILQKGDTLRIHVWDGSDLDWQKLAIIALDGTVDLQELGPIEVAGISLGDAKSTISAHVKERYLQAKVNVNIEDRRALQIVVAGNATYPGIYHLPTGATLLTALSECGGPSKTGTYRDIVINRKDGTKKTADLYQLLNEGKREWDIPLVSGDTIWIRHRGSQVRLAGAVMKQAYYEMIKPTRIHTLLKWAGLKGMSFTGHITIERFTNGEHRDIITIKKEQWETAQDSLLQEGDRITVETISELVANPLFLKGNVERPGRFQWSPGIKAADLISLGGRLLDDTDYTRLDIRRKLGAPAFFQYSGSNQTIRQERELISLRLSDVLAGVKGQNIDLQPHDELIIYNIRAVRPPPKATISGEVFKPGSYEIQAGMRVIDLVHLAGGLKPDANLMSCQIIRKKFVDFEADYAYTTEKIVVDLRPILNGNSKSDVRLENYDHVRIDRVPDFAVRVDISGDVRNPGEYVLPKGARLSDLLVESGGYLNTAYPRGARFFRGSVREKQEIARKRYIQEQRARMQAMLAETISESEFKSKRHALSMRTYENLLANLETAESKGRIAINIAMPREQFEDSEYNLLLNEGDQLVIPSTPGEVSIQGEVFNSASIVFDNKLNLNDYLAMSGGVREAADKKAIYIFKMNGTAISAKSLRSKGGLGAFFRGSPRKAMANHQIEPGDIIYVPPKFDLHDEWDFTRGIIDIVFKTAVTAGIITSVGL